MSGTDAPRVLVVLWKSPYPTRTGGQLRLAHVLPAIGREASVEVLVPSRVPTGDVEALRRRTGVPVHVAPVAPRGRIGWAARWLTSGDRLALAAWDLAGFRERALDLAGSGRFDRLWLAGVHEAAMLGEAVLRRLPHTIDLQHVDGVAAREAAARRRPIERPVWSLDARRRERQEARLLRGADQLTITNDADRRRLGVEATVVPAGCLVPRHARTDEHRRADVVGFVGNMHYRPNRDSVDLLAREVLPAIRRTRPATVLELAGPGSDALAADLGLDGVTGLGWVEDLETWFATVTCLANPLFTGTGTRVKVLDGLACGVATVASPRALEGLRPDLDDAVLLAHDPRGFADSLAHLLAHPDEAAALGRRAERAVADRFSWPATADRYASVVRAAWGGGPPTPTEDGP